MGMFWRLIVGESVIFILFHGSWASQLPGWMSWPGWVGSSILVGILSFVDLGDGNGGD